MSAWMNPNSERRSRSQARFFSLPGRDRLSKMMTSCPSWRRRTTVLAPMNPAPPVTNHRMGPSASVLAQPQDGQERILRDLDRPDALHTLLALLLPFEQLLLARHVACVALGQ